MRDKYRFTTPWSFIQNPPKTPSPLILNIDKNDNNNDNDNDEDDKHDDNDDVDDVYS